MVHDFTVCVPEKSTARATTTQTSINTTTHRPDVTTRTSAASVPGCLLIHGLKLSGTKVTGSLAALRQLTFYWFRQCERTQRLLCIILPSIS